MFSYSATMRAVRFALGACLLCTFPFSASAYRVKPLIVQLEPTGESAKADVLIENTHDYPLALEFSASERIIADDGTEKEIPKDEDFLIFPPQAVVAPGKTQRIQIRYLGNTTTESRAYRLHIEQADIDIEETGKRVGFSVAFHPAIYVTPAGARFNISVKSITPTDQGYEVLAHNNGNRHAVLTTGDWLAKDSSGKTALIDLKIAEIKKAPMIAPGQTRIIQLPAGALNGLSDLKELEISPTR